MRKFLIALYITLFIFPFLVANIQPLYATGTRMWPDLVQSGFAKGKLENISAHSSGKLTLSPHIHKLSDITATYVWCLATNETGLILAGTGDPGSIFKITQDGNVIEFFKTSELHVHTIAIDTAGNVYAGTLPHGRIYKVTPDGEGKILCELPDPYIWDLIIDGNNNLYAATGNNGIIYKISSEGTPSVFFDSPYSNILDLVIDSENNIYAASEPKGLIYKITVNGDASVLYDAKEDEIHCLAIGNKNGILYAGTSSGTPPALPVSSSPAKSQAQLPPPIEGFPYESSAVFLNGGTANTKNAEQPSLEEGYIDDKIKRPPVASKKNAVYSIDKDGRVKKVLSAKKAFVLCINIDDNNDVLVGTGNKANLFKINNTNGEDTLLYNDFYSSQILDILTYKDGRKYISTGNNAGIYQLSDGYSKKGVYESTVHYAGYISYWGSITWKGKTSPLTEIKLTTRSGNSKKPDATWSDWSREYIHSGEKITSPPARFIQYRAILSTGDPTATPVLDNVCIAYLPQNQSPIIDNIEITTTKDNSKKKSNINNNTKTSKQDLNNVSNSKKDENVFDIVVHKPKKLISWLSYDPNNDRLQFDLVYKSEDEKGWKELKKNIREKDEYYWVTSSIPDGHYRIKITASDIPDNPIELALRGEKVSNTFLIDNTSPTISEFKKIVDKDNTLVISGVARDEMCNISNIQYTVNSGDWNMVFPVDNIFDSKEEFFTIKIPDIYLEQSTIEIKAKDTEENTGSKKIIFIP